MVHIYFNQMLMLSRQPFRILTLPLFFLTVVTTLVPVNDSATIFTLLPETEAMPAESDIFYTERFIPGEPLNFIDESRSAFKSFQGQNYPPDPTADIDWVCGFRTVNDIECAFNSARTLENRQLGTSIPMITLPDQADWNAMSDGERAIWLINLERVDRGVDPLHSLESNVTSVAQYYAEYLIYSQTWGHYEDGRSPWGRLNDNPAIRVCHDFLAVAENLALFMTSGSSVPLPVERSVFHWMYDDGSCCAWGHRHTILWQSYNDNSGASGMEGFLGIGRSSGPHSGWNYAELVVMNVFDPCSTWDYRSKAKRGIPWLPLLLKD